jgi:hypothetical protein
MVLQKADTHVSEVCDASIFKEMKGENGNYSLYPSVRLLVVMSHETAFIVFVVFEVFTAVVKKMYVFWGGTPCSPLKGNWRLGGTRRLHVHGRRMSQTRKHRKTGSEQSVISQKIEHFFVFGAFWNRTAGVKQRSVGSAIFRQSWKHEGRL